MNIFHFSHLQLQRLNYYWADTRLFDDASCAKCYLSTLWVWDVYVGLFLFARQKSILAFFSPPSCSCSKQLVLVSLPTLYNGFTRTNKFMSSVMATVILNYLGCFTIRKKLETSGSWIWIHFLFSNAVEWQGSVFWHFQHVGLKWRRLANPVIKKLSRMYCTEGITFTSDQI